jgi:hypothetical protein
MAKRALKTHRGKISSSASAANASDFLQIPLSQVPRRETFRSTQTLGAGALVDRVLRFNVNYEPVSELSTIHESDVIWHCERYGDYANNQSCPRTSGYKKKKGGGGI